MNGRVARQLRHAARDRVKGRGGFGWRRTYRFMKRAYTLRGRG